MPNAGTVLRGRRWVIDGDTIVINDVRLRLAGIDAPEHAITPGVIAVRHVRMGWSRCGNSPAVDYMFCPGNGRRSIRRKEGDEVGDLPGIGWTSQRYAAQ